LKGHGIEKITSITHHWSICGYCQNALDDTRIPLWYRNYGRLFRGISRVNV